MHHSQTESPALSNEIKRIFEDAGAMTPVGATGRFPEGKLTPEDEGEIQFGIGKFRDEEGRTKVAIEFGKPVHWVAMNAQQALDLAESLRKHAREILNS
jgi:hypothetical protein